MDDIPQSILFCCDHNSVRSPMAEGIAKKIFGTAVYLQSAGVRGDRDIDGFAIAVCSEVDVELSRHRSRSFDQMADWGDDLSSFDLIVALSPASHTRALELTSTSHLEVEFWPILDPTGVGDNREAQLASFRLARDQIHERLMARWGGAPNA